MHSPYTSQQSYQQFNFQKKSDSQYSTVLTKDIQNQSFKIIILQNNGFKISDISKMKTQQELDFIPR